MKGITVLVKIMGFFFPLYLGALANYLFCLYYGAKCDLSTCMVSLISNVY